jgi:hypothetical protein
MAKLYGKFLQAAMNKEVDYDTDTIKVALLSASYNPNQDTHAYWADVSGSQVSGAGYTAGGATLASKTVAYDAATNTVILDAADVVWPNSTITARYAVIYDDSPSTAAAKPLIGYVDFGAEQSSSNGNFTITWDATGIVRLSAA